MTLLPDFALNWNWYKKFFDHYEQPVYCRLFRAHSFESECHNPVWLIHIVCFEELFKIQCTIIKLTDALSMISYTNRITVIIN